METTDQLIWTDYSYFARETDIQMQKIVGLLVVVLSQTEEDQLDQQDRFDWHSIYVYFLDVFTYNMALCNYLLGNKFQQSKYNGEVI